MACDNLAWRATHADSLRDLFIEELEILTLRRRRLSMSLPDLAAARTSPDLRRAFDEHLRQTAAHRDRLG